jgi:photosystem II PsbJ protein
MADTNRRVPLWLIALSGGLAVFSLAGLFIYGSYSGLGSSW